MKLLFIILFVFTIDVVISRHPARQRPAIHCDTWSHEKDCIYDCDCAWCINKTKCYNQEWVKCDDFLTEANTKRCAQYTTAFFIKMVIVIFTIAICGFLCVMTFVLGPDMYHRYKNYYYTQIK